MPSLRSNNLGGTTRSFNLQNAESVAHTLQNQSTVFIKNYGPGSLATSSIRGGSAGHTLVLWNGLPIQNPFLGLLDLSLLDTWAMDKMELQKGGHSAMWGSGAIGGVIDLQQKPHLKSKFQVENRLAYGSFGRWEEKLKIGIASKKFQSVSSISYLTAQNDFTYPLTNGELRTQENAMQRQLNINQDFYWLIDQKNQITGHYWRSRNNRENPPTTVQRKSEAYQFDGADRVTLHWNHYEENTTLKAKAGYYIEDLNYFDPQQGIESITHFETFLADTDYEINLGTHHDFNFGFSHFRTAVQSPANYANDATEVKSAWFGRYQYKWFQISGRQEVVNGALVPFTPSTAFAFPIGGGISSKGKISRNYRLPTLNDRFWVPGGKPDLLPEAGWSQEFTLTYKKAKDRLSLQIENTVFNRQINNWIQWTLDGPFNINQVWSRGLEFQINTNWTAEKFTQNLHAGYNYILSTSKKALQFPKINAGDQLFYTPIHQGHLQYHFQFRNIKLSYRQILVGKTSGINDHLDGYTIGDFDVSYQTGSFVLEAQLRNVWNKNYRIIERRPMPGRNFEIALSYTFTKY